jgi:uncharacterized membrane protein
VQLLKKLEAKGKKKKSGVEKFSLILGPWTRVARGHIFKQKIPIWVNLVLRWKMMVLFYGHSVYFVAIWCICMVICIFSLFWYIVRKNLATLPRTGPRTLRAKEVLLIW